MTGLPSKPPPPLEWHPYYSRWTYLLDWLNERGTWSSLYTVRIPRPVPITVLYTTETEPHTEPHTVHEHIHTLTRHRCNAPAPYVGWPFVYTWNAAVDEHDRCIAGESRRRYLPWHPSYPYEIWEQQPDDEQDPDGRP